VEFIICGIIYLLIYRQPHPEAPLETEIKTSRDVPCVNIGAAVLAISWSAFYPSACFSPHHSGGRSTAVVAIVPRMYQSLSHSLRWKAEVE